MTRRMAPSPDNYRTIYNEIAGINDKAAEVFPEKELRALIGALPKEVPLQQRLARELDQALKDQHWENYKKTLVDFITEHSTDADLGWGELIAELIRQWDAKQSSLTPARKREALEHVLASASKNSEILFERLQRLVKSWASNRVETGENSLVDGEITPQAGEIEDHAQGVATGRHLGVVLDDPLDADFLDGAQLLLVVAHLVAEHLQDLLLQAHGHQQEVAHVGGLQVVEVVRRGAAGISHLGAHEVQFDDTGEDGLGGRYKVGAVAGFVAQGPEDDGGMVLGAVNHAHVALHVRLLPGGFPGNVHAAVGVDLDTGADCMKCHSRIAHGSNHLEGGIKVE